MIAGFICQVNMKCNKCCLFKELHYKAQYTVCVQAVRFCNVKAVTALFNCQM